MTRQFSGTINNLIVFSFGILHFVRISFRSHSPSSFVFSSRYLESCALSKRQAERADFQETFPLSRFREFRGFRKISAPNEPRSFLSSTESARDYKIAPTFYRRVDPKWREKKRKGNVWYYKRFVGRLIFVAGYLVTRTE